MDFFEHQEAARRRTHLLVFYFVLALLGIIAAVYGLAVIVIALVGGDAGGVAVGTVPATGMPLPALWNPPAFFLSAGGTGSVVFLASTYKTLQLSGGGAVVARELGGRELDPNTTDFHERRLLNIVEEMAIASGLPVPAVYVMDAEDGINAFAAGKTPSDAVVGVTRGCLTLLSRDELQGVVAHEFSHILNGDMRLNLRLMGLLFGILFLALIGELILRNSFRATGSNRKEGAGLALVLLATGLGLLLIGYIGGFFAKLIKASVSRQREFLADAAAVQFTRNPEGIGGALKKIGGLAAGSRVAHPMAKDASHLFFGSAVRGSLFATHPPLAERVRRLLPQWDGQFPAVGLAPVVEERGALRSSKPEAVAGFASAPAEMLRLGPAEAAESFRTLHPEQVELGRELLERLPESWLGACRSRSGAQCLVFGLLLAQDGELRGRELEQLAQEVGAESARIAAELSGELAGIHSTWKIALLDLAIPTLRHLSHGEYLRFRETLRRLIASDGRTDLFEFMLMQMVTRHLDAGFFKKRPEPIRHHRFEALVGDAAAVVSTLVDFSHPGDEGKQEEAFARAAALLRRDLRVELSRQPANDGGLDRIRKALAALARASPRLKKHFIEACSLAAMDDEALTSREAELVRAVADAVGCPIPPFIRTARAV